jgi:hypothetical protein
MSKWTSFMDMHSGGGCKTDWEHIVIEAPSVIAIEVFERILDRDPHNVTCDCCGSDYAIDEHATLEEATKYINTESTRIIDKAEAKLAYTPPEW